MRSRRPLISLALTAGLTAAACDLPPDEPGKTAADPLTVVGLDEADQVPNLLATVETGTSIVMFSEPIPGTVMVLEKARGKAAVRPNVRDYRQLWKTLAPGREPPLALRESLDRFDRLEQEKNPTLRLSPGESRAPVVPPRPSGAQRAQQLESMARDFRENSELTARFEQQLAAGRQGPEVNADGGCGDRQHFINTYCSNWMYVANVDEACKLNKIWNGSANSDATFGAWNDVEYSFAAVCGLTGEFDFVVQHQTWWSWSTACDLNTTAGIHWNMTLRSSGLDWDFRYILQRAGGDTYHRAHFVDYDWFDPMGLGNHTIPPS